MAVMKTTREVRGVGLAIPRPDGPAKVTGQTQYVADIEPREVKAPPLPRRARDEIMSPPAPATTP